MMTKPDNVCGDARLLRIVAQLMRLYELVYGLALAAPTGFIENLRKQNNNNIKVAENLSFQQEHASIWNQ